MKLLKLASTCTGHIFREKIEYSLQGTVYLLNTEILQEGGLVHIGTENIRKVVAYKIKENTIIKKGDILFKAKGLTNTAHYVDSVPENTTITGSFFIIRVESSLITPQYLCWWLNQPMAAEYFEKISGARTGATISSVSLKAIADLDVIIPSKEKQMEIVKIAELARKESFLLKEIAEKKALYIKKFLYENFIETVEQNQ